MNDYKDHHPKKQQRNWKEEFKPEWITNGITKDCVKFSEDFGKFAAENKLSTSQFRNVFGELKRIQMGGFIKERTSFILLKPKMAYAYSRKKNEGLKQLKNIFDKAYDVVDTKSDMGKKHFNNLVNFMEAILSYHKIYGGK